LSLKQKTTEFKMKSLFALVLLSASFASAVSMKPYDKWTCYFSYKYDGGIIRGAYVNVNFDMRKQQGSAVMMADCPNCRVMPKQVSVTRVVSREQLSYVNVKENFSLNLFWSALTKPGSALPATFNGKSGSCTPVN
jgi:hypothetical protein